MDLRLANDLKWWWLSIEEHKKMSFLWTVALMFIALVVVRMSRWLYRQEILTDTDVNSEIFRQENKSFVCTIFEGSQSVFGKDNVFLEHGNIHKQIKQITLQLLGSEGLKRKMIGDMDRATREHLQSKANDGSFNVKDTVASARKVAIKMIQDVFKRRRASSEKYGDFLDTMLEELEKDGSFFNDESAIGLIFIISVITQETTSSSIVLIMKFLSENPKVVAELKREHEMILQDRDDEQSGVSWEEYRQKMSFTNMVINESLRLGSMAPVQFKKAVEDVEINGK